MDFSNVLITDLEFESLGHSLVEFMSYPKAEAQKEAWEVGRRPCFPKPTQHTQKVWKMLTFVPLHFFPGNQCTYNFLNYF